MKAFIVLGKMECRVLNHNASSFRFTSSTESSKWMPESPRILMQQLGQSVDAN